MDDGSIQPGQRTIECIELIAPSHEAPPPSVDSDPPAPPATKESEQPHSVLSASSLLPTDQEETMNGRSHQNGRNGEKVDVRAVRTEEGSIEVLAEYEEEEDEEDFIPSKDDTLARAKAVSLLSWIYTLILCVLAVVLETTAIVSSEIPQASQYDPFYVYLYLMSIAFMLYVQFFLLKTGPRKSFAALMAKLTGRRGGRSRKRKKRIASHSAPGASSLYLRIGMLMFGILGILYYVMGVGECAVMKTCKVQDVFTSAISCIFIILQMFFIFENSKVVIHKLKHVGRFGTMHLMATNLCVWLKLFIMEDFLETMEAIEEGESTNEIDFGEKVKETSSEVIEKIVEKREASERQFLGSCNLDNQLSCYYQDFKPLLTTSLIEYSLICGAVAFIIWRNVGIQPQKSKRRKRRRIRCDCSNSSTGILTGMLFLIVTIILMVIFLIKVHVHDDQNALWIFYLSDSAFYFLTLIAVFVGLWKMRNLAFTIPKETAVVLLDDILLFVGLTGQLVFCLFTIVSLPLSSPLTAIIVLCSLLRILQVIAQTFFILAAQRLKIVGIDLREEKPGRQLVVFLLIANIAFFLINTFETHKATTNPIMLQFFGKKAWAIIVHAAVPLTIFYRFHSSVCLAEIWKSSYSIKK